MKEWIFLSTHFDDVVLSAGGLAWELTNRGDRVEIWTICAGDPPFGKPLADYAKMLHIFWEFGDEDVPFLRSQEDLACCRVLGAAYRRFTVPDCIYRFLPGSDEPVIKVPDDIEAPLEPDEAHLIPPVTDFLRKNLPEGCELVIPLTIGHHRDHVLTRTAAERLGIPLWHYVDYPYIIQEQYDLAEWIPAQAEQFSLAVSSEGLKAWQDGIACHRSQIVFFWADVAEMRLGIEAYSKSSAGGTLWKF
jgi:LmbE family N-acetylglucosaminyl deacetylase